MSDNHQEKRKGLPEQPRWIVFSVITSVALMFISVGFLEQGQQLLDILERMQEIDDISEESIGQYARSIFSSGKLSITTGPEVDSRNLLGAYLYKLDSKLLALRTTSNLSGLDQEEIRYFQSSLSLASLSMTDAINQFNSGADTLAVQFKLGSVIDALDELINGFEARGGESIPGMEKTLSDLRDTRNLIFGVLMLLGILSMGLPEYTRMIKRFRGARQERSQPAQSTVRPANMQRPDKTRIPVQLRGGNQLELREPGTKRLNWREFLGLQRRDSKETDEK
jgi:hypothetical protein